MGIVVMLLPIELLPFSARRRLRELPTRLLGAVAHAEGRAVLRDWAREHDDAELLEALDPPRFFQHALKLIVGELAPREEATVDLSMNQLILTVHERDYVWSRPLNGGPPDLHTYCAEQWPWRTPLREAIWRVGLRTTGLDEVYCLEEAHDENGEDRYLRWQTGWEPRVDFERFRVP